MIAVYPSEKIKNYNALVFVSFCPKEDIFKGRLGIGWEARDASLLFLLFL